MSSRAKSSHCRQPLKSVQESGGINLKNGFFPVLDRFRALRESCVAGRQILLANHVTNFAHAR